MGIFNEHTTKSDTISSNIQGQQGPPGRPGVGFKLDSNNNFDLENRKLTNLKSGTDPDDVINKSQLDGQTSLLQLRCTFRLCCQ